jgi:iron complex outermembrane recepter protein
MGIIAGNRLCAALLGCIAALSLSPAGAQDATVELPDIDVTSSRLGTTKPREPARETTPRVERAAAAPAAGGGSGGGGGAGGGGGTGEVKVELPSGITTGTTITGASTTVITSTQIERSPSATVQDVLAREPGIQVRSLFGAVNGTASTVDLRGFGATATSNTLVLINGRRLNDIDLAGVDLSTLPRESIDHIEVTRGNSGAVLYGDGAVGGVINIVTKTGVGLPPSARIAGTFGTFNYTEGAASANGSWSGKWGTASASAYANEISSDGYRLNNRLNQRNAVGDFRYSGGQGNVYFNIAADDQRLGLPGGRRVSPTENLVDSDPRGAATPFDYAAKQGFNLTAGVTRMVAPGTEMIIDGGMRQKKQQAGFFIAGAPVFDSYVDAQLNTFSLTPRLVSNHGLGGMQGKLITGMDIYESIFEQGRSQHVGLPLIHKYNLAQLTGALYAMETVNVRPNTDVGMGIRVQRNSISARDRFDINAPGASPFDAQGLPLEGSENQRAWHIGLDHRITQQLAVFARMARSFRVPTVDERVGLGVPTNFNLRTQTSRDYEAGVRVHIGNVEMQSSVYLMNLQDEIFFSPATFTNVNLDPTRRYGWETAATWQATKELQFKLGLAVTRAIFVEGPFAGNDVPLVARWTQSVGVSWDIYQKYLVLDAVARLVGTRRMDNDSANVQPLIPRSTVVDLRIGGTIDKFFWAFSVQNLFDVHYFEYAAASTFALNTYSAYPLPGRTFMVKAGVTF